VTTAVRTLQVWNPAHGSVVGTLRYMGGAEAHAAADAAAAAFPTWSSRPARERSDLLLKASGLVSERSADIGLLPARESGKRLPEAVRKVRFAAEYFRWFAEEARRPTGEIIPQEMRSRRHMTTTRPSGVAVCLTPWNFPVSIQAR